MQSIKNKRPLCVFIPPGTHVLFERWWPYGRTGLLLPHLYLDLPGGLCYNLRQFTSLCIDLRFDCVIIKKLFLKKGISREKKSHNPDKYRRKKELRIPRAHGYQRRQGGDCSPSEKRQKKTFPLMLKTATTILINAYQRTVRPFLPHTCRFWPSCSEYANQAVARYGLAWGLVKATRRICSCHPLSGKSGYDPLV